jgi:hypothetical protein
MVIADLLLAIDDQNAIELHDVGVVVAELVPGSVAADNYILGHVTSQEDKSDKSIEPVGVRETNSITSG